MKLDVVVAAFWFALPAAAGEGASLSVQEIRSTLRAEEDKAMDAAGLADQVRDVARRILPDVNVVEAGEAGALAVSGEVVRLEQGYLVSLELREARSSKLEGTAAAAASTPEELVEAVASAAVDLFRGYKAASSLVLAAAAQPAPPAPIGKLDVAGVDANVLVAIDEARSAEAQSADDAAAAWRAAAELPGVNPLREMAAARAKEWRAYADGKRAWEAQLFRDTARLKKVLPLAAVSDATKIELLVRYTRAYGAARASALLSLVPPPARTDAALSVGCEAKEASKCVALAKGAKDPKVAAGYFDQACAASDVEACADAGDRFLREETRDPARAIATLQRGCAGGGGAACARLARVYEEGDGAVPNLALAAESRDKACTAGDGASCRKLACDVPSALPRAAELWQRGCKAGDPISCALARLSRTQSGPVDGSQVAKATPPAGQTAAAAPPSASSDAQSAAATRSNGHRNAGYAFLAVATVVAGGALIMSSDYPGEGDRHFGRNWLTDGRAAPSHGRSALPMVLGGAAVLSAATGIGFLLSKPSDPSRLQVGVSPAGVALSGTLP